MKEILLPDVAAKGRLYAGFFDDFDHQVDADLWTVVATDSGDFTIQDQVGGVGTLSPSDGTVADNDESYLKTTHELFLFAASQPIIIEARINFAEAATDDANILFGLMNAVAANSLQDNGAGPAADYSGAVFFKEDGQTLWSVESSLSTTQTTTQLSSTNSLTGVDETAGKATDQVLRIEVHPLTSTKMDITFWRDGKLVGKHKDVTYTGATEMNAVLGVKNGGGTEDTVDIDYFLGYQARAAIT